ncbi:MAG TPA: hypothetical protein VI461_08735, partial [Chitinophagaceae bacterium]|nr:hypothetical protein [Chitinophagaceae bacterium]
MSIDFRNIIFSKPVYENVFKQLFAGKGLMGIVFLLMILTGGKLAAQCPTITAQPLSQTDCKGNSVEFTANFTSGTPVTYQWQSSSDGINWTDISGAWPNISGASGITSTSPIILTVGNVGVGGANGVNTSETRYRVIITNASVPCSDTSDGLAVLTVNQITGITP